MEKKGNRMIKSSKKKKLKPDTVLKEFFRKPEYFADVFNGVCFQGKQVILPEHLVEIDTDISHTRRKGEKWSESLVRMRDIAKRATFQLNFVVLGQELQTYIDYAMPLRVNMYDTSSLYLEFNRIKDTHKIRKTKMNRDEFLSGMTKEDKLHPVITIVIYVGEKEWDGARSLKEMFVDVPEELKPHLPDYKMKLLEVHHFEKYPFQNKEVKTLFGVLKRCYEKEWKKLEQEYPKISVEVAEVIESVVQFDGLSEMKEEQEGEIVMCQAMAELKHQYWLEGRDEGRNEGERLGLLRGRSEGEKLGLLRGRSEGEKLGLLRGRSEGEKLGRNQGILFSAKKMLENGISYEQIEKMLGVTKKEIEQYRGE